MEDAALHAPLKELAGLTDDELLQTLSACGIAVDRDFLERLTRNFPSFQTMTAWLLKEQRIDLPEEHPDRLRIRASLIHLAQRWFPDRLRFEQLDELIQRGLRDPAVIAEAWSRAWRTIIDLRKSFRFDSLDDLDQCLNGAIPLRDWLSLYLDWIEQLPAGSTERTALRESLLPAAERMCRESDGAFADLLPRVTAAFQE